MPLQDGAEFFRKLAGSRLFKAHEVRRLYGQADRQVRNDATAAAAWLLKSRQITPYQRRRLLDAGDTEPLKIGPYVVKDLLGQGGMGRVYLAWDTKRSGHVALKVLAPDKADDEKNVLRFRREMRVGQRLEHDGIARVLEAGTWKDVHLLAMEYVPGRNLYQRVRQGGPVSPALAVRWLSQVAATLDYIHLRGVVHRDLKPSNVIVTPEGVAKLLDMGLARWFDDDHNEESVIGVRRIVGSFDYIAPEQARNSAQADARSDIYGLGCIMYFLLAGRPPFADVAGTREKIAHHAGVQPESIERLGAGVPPGLAAVVAKMMAKDPADRYMVAEEVHLLLERWSQRLTLEAAERVSAASIDRHSV